MPFSYDTNSSLPKMEQQLFSNWCWAASTLFVCSYYQTNPSLTQPKLVADVLNMPVCASGIAYPACNSTCDISIPFTRVGHLDGEPIDNPLSDTDLITQFSNGPKPVGCQMLIPNIGGHAVVIINVQPIGINGVYLTVGDPADGSILTMSYDKFRTNYRDQGGYWVRSYLTRQQ